MGAAPETVMVSSSPPTFMSALMDAVKFAERSNPSRLTVAKPAREKVTL